MNTKRNAWKPSKWYRDAVALDRARETRQRASDAARKGVESDRRAIEYAGWMLRRDGCPFPAGSAGRVEYERVDVDGTLQDRARYVTLWPGMRDVWGNYQRVPNAPAMRIELPGWDFVPRCSVEHADDQMRLAA